MLRVGLPPAVQRSGGKGQWHHLRRHKKNITELPKGKWADELPRVIWSHNTTESRTTKFTPFKLLYGEEAVTPEEIKLKSWRTAEGAENIEEDIKPSIETSSNQLGKISRGNTKVEE